MSATKTKPTDETDLDDTDETESNPPPGNVGVFTARAIIVLRSGSPGDLLTPADMTAKIGRPCGKFEKGNSNVRAAIRIVRRDYHLAWQWSRPDQAWRCLKTGEHDGAASQKLRLIRRRARDTRELVECADLESLTPEQRQKHVAIATVAALIDTAGQNRTVEGVARENIGCECDSKKLLEFFRKS